MAWAPCRAGDRKSNVRHRYNMLTQSAGSDALITKQSLHETRGTCQQQVYFVQVCLPCGQAACCAHAALLKQDQNCLSHSWLHQNPSHRRGPRRSSGHLVTAGPQLEARTRFYKVRDEFAKAGVSAADSKKVLKQCKEYLQWDCESKLQPALQSWLQELGSEKLREVLVCSTLAGAQPSRL